MQNLIQKLAQSWLQGSVTVLHNLNQPNPPHWSVRVGEFSPQHGCGRIICTLDRNNPDDLLDTESFTLAWSLEGTVVPEDGDYSNTPGTGLGIVLRLAPGTRCSVRILSSFPIRAAHDLEPLASVLIPVADAQV